MNIKKKLPVENIHHLIFNQNEYIMILFEFLTTLNPWQWLSLATLLLIIELLIANTGFLLWIAIAAGITGILQWLIPGLIWYYQYTIFIIVTLLYSIIGKKYFRRIAIPQVKKTFLNRRAEQYVGRTFFLEQPIVNGRGSIYVDDSVWRVEGPDLPEGTQVRVVAADGVILKVLEVES